MAENPTDPAEAGQDQPDAGAANAPAPQIGVESQYIKDLSFENPMGPNAGAAIQRQPQVEVEVTTSARSLSPGRFEVSLIIRGQAKTQDATVFIAELTYAGVITLSNVPEEAVQPVLFIEGPRLLFPFARNILAEVTRDGGFPPLFINPIDFVQLYRDQHMAKDGSEEVGYGTA